jgi:enediyne biosynthesis protein E4
VNETNMNPINEKYDRIIELNPMKHSIINRPSVLGLFIWGLSFTVSSDLLAEPAISRQPVAFPILSLGDSVTNQVTASGVAPLQYQWHFNGTPLAGRTNRTLVVTNLNTTVVGDYHVTVADTTGVVTSQVARLEIDPAFTKITDSPVVQARRSSWDVAWGDYDQDGDLDLFVINFAPVAAPPGEADILFRNNGNGTFDRITEGPIVNDQGVGISGHFADYDNDGDLDLFVSNVAGGNVKAQLLWVNQGDGTFRQSTNAPTASTGGGGRQAAWADYDRDGNLDLFVGTVGRAALYHNTGDGAFLEMRDSVVRDVATDNAGATWGDFDDDGSPDLFVANIGVVKNFLYRNDQHGGFTKITNGVVATEGGAANCASWADFDNDGDLDLFVGNDGADFLYLNQTRGLFEKVTNGPIVQDTGYSAASAWGDYDNDGFLDLFVGTDGGRSATLRNNKLFHNNGDGTFTKITTGSLVSYSGPRSGGAAWADYDNDGFLDLVVANRGGENEFLYRNNGNGNRWLKLKLVGTVSNRSAIGAKVRLQASIRGELRWQRRDISSDNGAPLDAHFGLGDATAASLLRIEWPSGIVQELRDVAANQFLTIAEPARIAAAGRGQLQIHCWRGQQFAIEHSRNLSLWTELGIVTNRTGILAFEDPETTQSATRFYRVKGR